jgi:hypothetical protein
MHALRRVVASPEPISLTPGGFSARRELAGALQTASF